MAAEDTTGLNWGTADLEREWIKRERLGPGMVVYESLNGVREDGESLEDDEGTGARQAVVDVSYEASGLGSGASFAEPVTPTATATVTATATRTVVSEERVVEPVVEATATAPAPAAAEVDPSTQFTAEEIRVEQVKKDLTAAAMPTSRVSRLLHYGGTLLAENRTGTIRAECCLSISHLFTTMFSALIRNIGLAASLGVGAFTETVRRSVGRGTANAESPVFLTPANMDRLVSKLTRMRGAALKLGQMLSIQGTVCCCYCCFVHCVGLFEDAY